MVRIRTNNLFLCHFFEVFLDLLLDFVVVSLLLLTKGDVVSAKLVIEEGKDVLA